MNGIEQGAHRDARGESRFRHRFSPRRAGILAALACVLATAAPAAAQQAIAGAPENPASALAHDRQTDIPDTLRQQLETIGEYADEVRHRTGRPDAAPMHPMDAAPPPDAAAARVSPEIDLPADPFEVSPRL
ncbi:MAG: hypothetical protein LBI59_08065, partial [Candidatus Accumulibacter sp.]|nr:hypothetical protein [Accumulibacter sp.]